MGESAQNQYAKNLLQPFGYPLRIPEPKSGLPSSYEEQGLQIGDVGYVDDDGMFEVLFNICFPSDHELHRDRCLLPGMVGLAKFNPSEASSIPNAFPSGRVICHDVRGSHGDDLDHTQSAGCKFVSCSTSGAILILPSGAVRQNLNKSKEEEFGELAGKWAPDWCRSAEETLLERNDAGKYNWSSKCDYRKSPGENRYENQTVLISGFKVEVKGWDEHAVVEKLVPHSRSIWFELTLMASSLLGVLVVLWRWMVSSYVFKLWEHGTPRAIVDGGVRIRRVPALSQPFHPSDVINHYLLDKNPNVQVAVTHDSQWQNMLEKNELLHEDMTEEGHFRAFLEENYTDGSHSDKVVYLRRKIDETNSEDYGDLHKSALSPMTFSIPALDGIRHVVITYMRAENAVTCLGRMPVGFYVLIQFNDTKKRSKTKTASLHASIIEWEDEITLPMDSSVKVRLSINASFEFEPMLGNGEPLCSSEVSVNDLVQAGSTYLLLSSESRTDGYLSCPSLLVTVEERRFDYLVESGQGDRRLRYDDRLCLNVAEATDKGHDALLRYHRDHEVAELSISIKQFTLALDLCPPGHKCRAAALFSLATARFINSQANGKLSDLGAAIESYRQAIELRPAPHPDRPGTQLNLAHALLYHYGRVRCESSVAEEIDMLVMEVRRTCHEGSYERRAADLVRQTLKRHQILTSRKLVELDGLMSELYQSVRMPPDWYFDRPYRMINLSAALRKCFELTGELDPLEKSISTIEEAAQLIPDGHFEKPWILVSLGDALCAHFVLRHDVADVDRSISMIEDAVKLTPGGHVEKPWMVTRLGIAFLVRFISGNISHLNISISITGSVVHLAWLNQPPDLGSMSIGTRSSSDFSDLERALLNLRDAAEHLPDGSPHRPGCLASLASSLLIRFWCLGNLIDLEEAVLWYKDAVELTPSAYPDKPDYLNNLALSLRARYQHLRDLSDLKEAISRHRDAVELIPDGHPNKPSHLSNLGNCFASRFERTHQLSDIEEAISNHKIAVALTPDDHPDKHIRLHNLAFFFSVRFWCLGEMDDIDGAASNLADAIKLTPHGHPNKSVYLNHLTFTLEARFQHLVKLTKLGLLRAVKLP